MLEQLKTSDLSAVETCLGRWGIVNFKPHELKCKCGCGWRLDEEALRTLQMLRSDWGPIYVTSAYRCHDYNRRVGGEQNSYHLTGKAFDIGCAEDAKTRLSLAVKAGHAGFRGFGNYRTFVHLDTGGFRTWTSGSDLLQE